MKERFLVDGLRGTSDVAMAALERLIRQTSRPEKILECGREQVAEFRRSVRPFIRNVLAMVAEKLLIELKTSRRLQTNNLAHDVDP